MPRAQPRFEEAGGQRLPLGGVNGYAGVRGKQGKKKDKFQGTTPRKQHRPSHFETAKEAAIALAQLREDIELGMLQQPAPKKPAASAAAPVASATSNRSEVGVYLGYLLQRAPPVVPTVACALLSPQQAAAAAARGVAVAYADAAA